MIDKHIPRWIFASTSKHFAEHITDEHSVPMFIEAQYRNTSTLPDFCEFRLDGPRAVEHSSNYWELYCEINILVQIAVSTNFHRIHEVVGIVASGFSDIPVYKYGEGPEDTQDLLGCLHLIQDDRKRQRLEILHLGRIEVPTAIIQAIVEGHYSMQGDFR
jgi:hypothetical protein